MSQLDAREIVPGLVAYLDQDVLLQDARVSIALPQTCTDIRPFICYKVAGGESHWAPLTRVYRAERLSIRRRWRSGGMDSWRDSICYLNDGANVYVGPHVAFVEASYAERTERHTRSRVSVEGVAAIIQEIEAQRRRRVA